jgi:hypothetical protein
MSECLHINLVKQSGPMDGGAASTRYRCGVAPWGLRDLVVKWRGPIGDGGKGQETPQHEEIVRWIREVREQCADELEAALAKLEGCSAFFVVAPHEIGVSIGPPGGRHES